MRQPTGVYIYLGRELYEAIKAKASKKGLTAGEYCARLVKTEALRQHKRKPREYDFTGFKEKWESLNKGIEKDKHTYKVIWSDEDKEYVGLCAELPSLSWLAPTSKEALQGIKKIVAEVKEGYVTMAEEHKQLADMASSFYPPCGYCGNKDCPYCNPIQQGLDDAKQGKVSKINLSDL